MSYKRRRRGIETFQVVFDNPDETKKIYKPLNPMHYPASGLQGWFYTDEELNLLGHTMDAPEMIPAGAHWNFETGDGRIKSYANVWRDHANWTPPSNRYREKAPKAEQLEIVKTQPLTAELLREVLHYNAETGVFTWLIKRPGIVPGDVAGFMTEKGYWRIGIAGRLYLAHRLAWLYMKRRWPRQQIDHLDGDRANNVFANLRQATAAQNAQNRKARGRGFGGELQLLTRKARRVQEARSWPERESWTQAEAF